MHVVPNDGTSCLTLEEQYQTHVMERKRNKWVGERGGGGARFVMRKTFEAKLLPAMSVMRSRLFSDHFPSRLLFLPISELTLLI